MQSKDPYSAGITRLRRGISTVVPGHELARAVKDEDEYAHQPAKVLPTPNAAGALLASVAKQPAPSGTGRKGSHRPSS